MTIRLKRCPVGKMGSDNAHFFPANASFMGMSEGFLRLRLRNDIPDFNYRTQVYRSEQREEPFFRGRNRSAVGRNHFSVVGTIFPR